MRRTQFAWHASDNFSNIFRYLCMFGIDAKLQRHNQRDFSSNELEEFVVCHGTQYDETDRRTFVLINNIFFLYIYSGAHKT